MITSLRVRPFMMRTTAIALLFRALMPALIAAEPVVINRDGAWCWFQDERALVWRDKLTTASITRNGTVQASTWDWTTGSIDVTDLRADFGRDDHNVAALLLRDDGRMMAFYAKHHAEPLMHWRISVRPFDVTEWEPERTFNAGVAERFTYANPFQLSGEHGRIYLFWRGAGFNPTWSASDDGGAIWRPGANHIFSQKSERPYVKYASNGRDTIHFAFTEAHPDRPGHTSLYHAFYRLGQLCRSDGTIVRALTDGPVTPEEATRIFDGDGPDGEAWVWDIALDEAQQPVIAYTSHPSPHDIRYRYARWNGSSWEDREIAFAGERLYKGQEFYAGGICLDPDDTQVVYLSSNVNIAEGSPIPGGRYEIHRGETSDSGATWTWSHLTPGTTRNNLRPIVPARHPGKTFVLWERGDYRSYLDYETEIVALTDADVAPLKKHPAAAAGTAR